MRVPLENRITTNRIVQNVMEVGLIEKRDFRESFIGQHQHP